MGLQKCALNLNRIGKELQPHGTAQFPCAGYSAVYTDKPEDVIPWHWHEELEIVYVETGSLKLQIPGKTFHLGQGEGFVINSNLGGSSDNPELLSVRQGKKPCPRNVH